MAEKISPLGPVDPASLPPIDDETEKKAPWIVRKLVGSMTGRIVMSSYESLRAAGTNVVCLSPGGVAAVAAPAMGPISDALLTSLGDSILVELGVHTGFELSSKAANDLVFDYTAKKMIPIHSDILGTTAVKVLLITLKYKHTREDAALGFYRSSLHKDISLFSSIKDYLAVEKGWFSPYLFASGRRPVIPRSMKPDIVFCHGPFLSGDYKIGETLLAESATKIMLCDAPTPMSPTSEPDKPNSSKETVTTPDEHESLRSRFSSSLSVSASRLKSHFSKSRESSPTRCPEPEPTPTLTPLPPPPTPRRMLIQLIGLKPHRKLWSTSARPSESVINYILFNGCPAIVVPVKTGAPLLAWYAGMTLEQIWKVYLPETIEEEELVASAVVEDENEHGADAANYIGTRTFKGVIQVLFEYLDLCVDWDRVIIPDTVPSPVSGSTTSLATRGSTPSVPSTASEKSTASEEKEKKMVLRNALALLVAAAVRSGDSKEVNKEVDEERSGIAMWRIP